MNKINIAFVCILFVSCFAAKKQNKLSTEVFNTQGHRGARGLMPENTIPAMFRAIDCGVVTLEMDAVITKDHQVVLSHEPFFNHEITTRPNGEPVTAAEEKSLNMYKMDYAEVIRYDVGSRVLSRFPQQQKMHAVKPLLAAVIDSVAAYCQRNNHPLPAFNIETKTQPATDNIFHPDPEVFVTLLMQIITDKQIEARVTIQSFDIRTLQYLHRQYPKMQTALLVEGNEKRSLAIQLQQLGFIPTVYSPFHGLVTPLLVQQCKQMGMALIPWTVNELAQMQALKKMGVTGIISDYPQLFAQLQ